MRRSDDLRARREAVVRRHMAAENDHDYDNVLATFAHPRYELMATGQVFDGEAEVRRYFELSRTPFPDQRNELVSLRSTDDAVVVELDLLGTHRGPLAALAPTGREFRTRMCALFIFEDGGDGIICERVYFDAGSIVGQLTAP
ncbi:MAG: nuclear transport factor 2 family protein [Acidimicrobiales bacterium]